MKEDILEQIIEDSYVAQVGWFAKHNIKFRPRKDHPDYLVNKDSVNSDIDILAISTNHKHEDRVHVISCKSWQGGFTLSKWKSVLEGVADYNERDSETFLPREGWKYFRELVSDKWLDSFLTVIESETGQKDLTFVIAVTKINGTEQERTELEESEVLRSRFMRHSSSMKLKIVSLEELVRKFDERISNKDTPALESTDVGRILQLLKAAGFEMKKIGKA